MTSKSIFKQQKVYNMAGRNATTNSVKRSDYFKPKFSQLKCDVSENLRDDYGNLRELANRIKAAGGLLKPIIGMVKNGEFWVKSDGFRRYCALEILYKEEGIDMEVLFLPELKKDDKPLTQQQRILNMFIHAESKDLTMLEQARGILMLQQPMDGQPGLSLNQIAQKLGRSNAHISKVNRLNSAPPKLLELIKKGEIKGTQAIEMIVGGEVDDFLEKYEKGEFGSVQNGPSVWDATTAELTSTNDGEGERGGAAAAPARNVKRSASGKTARITKRDIQKSKGEESEINSWAVLKKFIKNFEGKPGTAEGQKIMSFIAKVMDNKMTEKDFARIFKK
jgi:hypothetical protein